MIPATRSCTRYGQAFVPCEDELHLEQPDRYLITFMGHDCYRFDISSVNSLDVFFYSTRSWSSHPSRELLQSNTNHSTNLGHRSAAHYRSSQFHDMNICNQTRMCHVRKSGLLKHDKYNLVISRSRHVHNRQSIDEMLAAYDNRVYLNIQTCDPMSVWFYMGTYVTCTTLCPWCMNISYM